MDIFEQPDVWDLNPFEYSPCTRVACRDAFYKSAELNAS